MFGGYFLFGDGGVRLEVVASDLAVGMAMEMGMDLGGFFVFFQASCFAWLVEFVCRCLSFDGEIGRAHV